MLHKATTQLAQRHQVIVAEDLAVANMTRRKPGAGAEAKPDPGRTDLDV